MGAANLSLWLLPAPGSEEQTKLQAVVDSLTEEYGVSTFPAHITFGTLAADFDAALVERAFEMFKDELYDVKLIFEALSIGSAGIYIAIHKDPVLEDIQQRFHKYMEAEVFVPLFPHMSLAYIANDAQRESAMGKLLDAGVCKQKEDKRVEIGGIGGFKIGSLYGAYCGGHHNIEPATWKIFLKIV